MSVAFWSEEIKVGKEVEVQPPEGYVLNVTQAALVVKDTKSAGLVLHLKTVSVDGDPVQATICTLRPVTCDQCTLQIVLGYDVPLKFVVEGDAKATLHISGYYQPGPDDGDSDDDMEFDDEDGEDDEDDAEEKEFSKAQYKKLLASTAAAAGKDKGKIVVEDVDDDEDDSDEDDSEEDAATEKFIKVIKLLIFFSSVIIVCLQY
jgi:hypothetical protein